MINLFFSSNIDIELFKYKDKISNISISPKNFLVESVVLDRKNLDDLIFIIISGKSKLYNNKLIEEFEYNKQEKNNYVKLKNTIISIIEDEIKKVNTDLTFLKDFIPLLEKANTISEYILTNKFGEKNINRFKNIMERTYRNTYKLSKGIYDNMIWKQYYMYNKKKVV